MNLALLRASLLKRSKLWQDQSFKPTPRSSTQPKLSTKWDTPEPSAQNAQTSTGDTLKKQTLVVTQAALELIVSLDRESERVRKFHSLKRGKVSKPVLRLLVFHAPQLKDIPSLRDGAMTWTSLPQVSSAFSPTVSLVSLTHLRTP